MQTFDKDQFIADCLAAVRSGDRPQAQVRELVERAVAAPAAIASEVRPWSESPMMTIWHRSAEFTALHIVWPPEVDLFAHDHNLWAVIGIYGGREDNSFYRRREDGGIEPHTGKTLHAKDVVALGSEVVHSVRNPTKEWTAALHCYGGEFFTTPRTMWDRKTLEPKDFDPEFVRGVLEAAADRARKATTPGERP
jgi:predicted metal-dependent enzyme (double-stranded beta helix superfamily)